MCVYIFLLLYVSQVSGSRLAGLRLQLGSAPLMTKEQVCSKSHVEVSVSSRMDKKTNRRLLISWWVPQVESADMIALYVTDPEVNLTSPVFTLSPSSTSGWSHTPLSETYLNYRDTFIPQCLGYWVIYWRGFEKVASSCLQTHPTWMWDHRDQLGRFRMTELFLPGTHDSAAYSVSFEARELTRFEKYVFTQEESVLSQLIHGVRYLDIRLGHHKNEGFYTHHGFVKLRHFQGVIDDVIVFLNNSRDIIILDLHHFPVGFKTQDVHHQLVKYIEDQLSEYMVTPALSWYSTLNDIWKTGKQLIVSYNNQAVVARGTHKLWYPVRHQWADTKKLDSLKTFLDSVMRKRPLGAWAAMAELTPDRWDVLLDSAGGLRTMAADTNIMVTEWFRGAWGVKCNIVAVDFIRGSGIVNAAIQWNLKKAFNLCM
ncbi:PI-PLC X domain-containing protein 1-like [Macrosteles quadrilineatus]|uniref:PI-PLC X domain-containing protein 1-like n=1 Tax=Macrosteles quadrilineatus TaxID=74068 RepID=UPI0023E2B9BD|nr:PI-PLC X domain-containing protein 1-like [Macrosteles quadrilineatus]